MQSVKQMTSAKLAREFQHVVAGSNKDNNGRQPSSGWASTSWKRKK